MKKLWAKIKLVWKGRAIAENLVQIKSKWKEPTFWVALLGNIASAIVSYQGLIPAEYAPALLIGNSIITAAYNYVRGLQKAQTDGVKPFNTSSEVWLGVATAVNNALIDMHTGGINNAYLAGTSVVLIHSIAAARDLANMRPKEVAAATGEPVEPAK